MIMYVLRRKRKRNGRAVQDRTYTGRYRLEGQGQVQTVALGVTDKRVAAEKLKAIVNQAERERAGLVLPEREVSAAQRPLLDHLADFIRKHKSQGHNRQYVEHLENRNERLFAECGWRLVRDVTPESFDAWRSQQKAMGAKTQNEYLAAISGLLKWLASRELIARNPLARVGRVDARGKERVKRRAISPEQFQRLLDVAGERRVVYLTAALTCLRRGALYALQWSDVFLDGDIPRIELPARLAKNRTEQTVHLHLDVIDELRNLRPADVKPRARVFAGLLPRTCNKVFKQHLIAAGIPFVDSRGHKFDFHALRHTACTWGGATGAGGSILQAFTGHKTPSQVARYVHADHMPVAGIVAKLPRFELSGTHIGTQKRVRSGQNLSQVVTLEESTGTTENDLVAPESRLAHKKTVGLVTNGQASPRGFEPLFPG
ncbi:tyrosine-type recombinase/integrase [Phycisphaerales bacterium AB-hyl4]|uniref:Tyrosine-type recombinase/integrase n=1 Tax=Natronomicrosphaera hydrolytica TaxID=3242702 RepID=A0ABV4UBD9_9BACT